LVSHLLGCLWSPQQIARILRSMWPDNRDMHVSHETIYNAIYAHPKGELRKELIACLRQGKSTRRPRSGGADRRGQIPEMVSIHVRPPEVNDRVMPGHWEGDLIKGAGNKSSVAVLVERTTRLVLLAKMPDATAESALAAFTFKLNSIAAPLRQTLTYDQGKEMSSHRELARNTNIRVYFYDPHSPWQRGTCENTNGLLRQMLPKGTDLSVHDQQALDSIADLLNNRPRQTLNWRSPIQAFRDLMQGIAEQADAIIH
jgi:IS30 family transposase